MASSAMNSVDPKQNNAASNNSAQSVQEYIVKMPKNKNRRFNVMRFSNSHKIDVTKWSQVKMERENNLKEFKADDDLPKYGAGSEFGREQREESRRKKYGIVSKKYNPEDQPWLLKLGGKGGKKYKGIREGGVTENTSYYVFTQAADGTFEAYPVEEWYNFTPIQRYKALSAEEAEEEFGRRDKVLNYFSIMVRKRLQKETNEDEEEDGEKQNSKKNKKKQSKDFKISDMDDWAKDSSDSEGNEDEEDSGPKTAKDKKKQKKEKVEDEGREESDEGDFDDKEVDYMTESSGSEPEMEEEKTNRELKGVEDEEALRKLFTSDEEEEEEENKETEENQENQEKAPEKEQKPKPKKKEGKDSSGESSSDTSDSDFDDTKIHAVFMQKQAKKNGSDNSASSSRANTPTRLNADGKDGHKLSKRKLTDAPMSASKKVKLESHGGSTTFVNSLDGITEEAIRRYLSRKPMTASELLHKFKSKKARLGVDQLVTRIADVLKKMDLLKRNIKGKMYLSLKT